MYPFWMKLKPRTPQKHYYIPFKFEEHWTFHDSCKSIIKNNGFWDFDPFKPY